ncbi:hypothetical protein HMPREF1348_01980, partial [Enterococcus faecium 505]
MEKYVILKGREKAGLHQSNKNSQTKIAPPIFVWLDLFPQMQAFEHRLYQEVV